MSLRPVKTILQELINDSNRRDSECIVADILPAINTDAVANEDQEKWIREIDFIDSPIYVHDYVGILNNFRG